MFLDCGVHSVWSKIQFIRPRYSAVIEPHLCKSSWVCKRGKYPGLR